VTAALGARSVAARGLPWNERVALGSRSNARAAGVVFGISTGAAAHSGEGRSIAIHEGLGALQERRVVMRARVEASGGRVNVGAREHAGYCGHARRVREARDGIARASLVKTRHAVGPREAIGKRGVRGDIQRDGVGRGCVGNRDCVEVASRVRRGAGVDGSVGGAGAEKRNRNEATKGVEQVHGRAKCEIRAWSRQCEGSVTQLVSTSALNAPSDP
jgi:hypothetical protein